MKVQFKTSDPEKVLNNLFSHCSLRLYLDDTNYCSIGRFSWTAAWRLKYFRNLPKIGEVLKVGSFCEFAKGSRIFLGAEHANERLVNHQFVSSAVFRNILDSYGLEKYTNPISRGKTVIGNCVLVSSEATILSGVSIAEGVVLGAGAIAASDIDRIGIFGGVPAKLIKPRDVLSSEIESYSKLSPTGIVDYLKGSKLLEECDLADDTYSIVLKVSSIGNNPMAAVNFTGIFNHSTNEIMPIESGSAFDSYIKQINAKPGTEIAWLENPFELLK